MRAVVTRPVEDAERIAAPLRARGVEVMLEPLLAIVPRAAAQVNTDGVQAYLLTSANGVRALSAALGSDEVARSVPVLAVGDQTARVAEEQGFTRILSAAGDVDALANLAKRTLRPEGGALLHAAGSQAAGDLAGELGAAGFEVRRAHLYDSRPAVGFSREFAEALRSGSVDAILFYSPRTAKTFATLAEDADLRDACRTVAAYCLSEAVAKNLADLPFAAVRVAPRPEQDALLGIFDDDNRHRYPVPAGAGDATSGKGERTMTDRPETQGRGSDKAEQATPEKESGTAGKKDVKASETAAPESRPGSVPAAGAKGPQATGPQDTKPEAKAGDTRAAAAPGTKAESAKTESPADARPRPGAAPASPARRKTGRAGRGRAIGTAVTVVLILLLVAYASLPWWRDTLPPEYQAWTETIMPRPAEDETLGALNQDVAGLREALGGVRATVQDLQSRIATLEQTVADLQQTVAQTPAAAVQTDGNGALAAEVASLREQVQALAAQPALDLQDDLQALRNRIQELEEGGVSAATVLSLSDRLAQVETMARTTASRQDQALAFLLAVGQLREAVEAGRAFDAELRTVRAVAPEDVTVADAVSGFANYASQGVPPLVVLRQRFAERADDIIRAAARPQDAEGWWNRTVDRFLSVVSVRRTEGEAVGDGTAAIVSRAEQRLAEGSLAAAVEELAKLEGAPAAEAAPWLQDARARLAAEDALAALTGEALARVAARTGSSAPSGTPAGAGGAGAATSAQEG